MDSDGADDRGAAFGRSIAHLRPRSVLATYLLWLLPGLSHYYLRNKRQGKFQILLAVVALPVTIVLLLLVSAIGCEDYFTYGGHCDPGEQAVAEVFSSLAIINLVTFSGLLPWKVVDLFTHYRDVGKLNRAIAGGRRGGAASPHGPAD